MKKNKLLMPIIGISATTASLVPLTSLASCNKVEALKVELNTSKSTKEKKLYANTSVAYFYFTQNDLVNYAKTRVKLVNLKINGADATVVSGLVKMAVDSAGGIRVTIDVATIYNHYNNPSSIEFDLMFVNAKTLKTCLVTGFSLSADQETKVPSPFKTDTSDTTIYGFAEDIDEFTDEDFANSTVDGQNIFQLMTVKAVEEKAPSKTSYSNVSLQADPLVPQKDDPLIPDTPSYIEVSVIDTYYKMVIPAKYTTIADEAFETEDSSGGKTEVITSIPKKVKELEFAVGSKMHFIGKEAFKKSPFIFVTLPSSIGKLDDSCFANTSNLMSMQFAPVRDASVASDPFIIPAGFLKSSAIPYIKLPNYVTTIEGDIEADTPAISSIQETLYIDFTDWSVEQTQNLKFTGSTTIQSANGIFLLTSGAKLAESLLKVFNDVAKITISNVSSGKLVNYNPYAYSVEEAEDPTEAYIDFIGENQQVLFELIEYLTKTSGKTLGLTLFRWEIPNYYYYEKNNKLLPVTDLSSKDALYKSPLLNLSSIVLPYKLENITEGLFSGLNLNLWQVYIPKTVETIEAAAFYKCIYLSTIEYGGTKAQWGQIDKYIGDDAPHWNAGCPEITVTCTDGTLTIPANPLDNVK